MRYVAGALIAFLLAIVQASSVEQFHILGVTPNLMLVFLVSWLVVRGVDDALPMIGVSAVTLGLVGMQDPGLVLLAMVPLALLGLVREMHVIHSETLLVLALVASASAAYETVLLGGIVVSELGGDVLLGMRSLVVPAMIVNLALALPIYLPMRLARPAPRRGWLAG
ncbi:MAG TPA: hypothetical protein VNM91_00655 [Dehalococcoidia bacterium]|nr:hypothetical protein [Dehalococcoidia bacterium]